MDGFRSFVVVDDYEHLASLGNDNPLMPLVEYLPQAKDVGLHLVAVRDTRGANKSDGVLDKLRYIRTPGLVGHGDPVEGALVDDIGPSVLIPGRAKEFSRQRSGQRLIQIAWLGPDD